MNKPRIVFMGMDVQSSMQALSALRDAEINVVMIVRAFMEAKPKANLKRKRSWISTGKSILRAIRRRIRGEKTPRGAWLECPDVPIVDQYGRIGDQLILRLKETAPDLICVAGFPQLLPKTIIEIPPFGIINLHPSLLPMYPGPSPYISMILNDEVEWGATVHYIDEHEDTGDILEQTRIMTRDDQTGNDIRREVWSDGVKMLAKTALAVLDGTARPRAQATVADKRRGARLKSPYVPIGLGGSGARLNRIARRMPCFAKTIIQIGSEWHKVMGVERHAIETKEIQEPRIRLSQHGERTNALCEFEDGAVELRLGGVIRRGQESGMVK